MNTRNVHPNREVTASLILRPTHKQSIALEPEYHSTFYFTRFISIRAVNIGHCIRRRRGVA